MASDLAAKSSFELNEKAASVTEDVSPNTHSSEWYAASRRVVRKLDMTLMPTIWILYIFNYLDRNSIAQAQLDGIEDDLNLVGTQLNSAISLLNVGYMTMQIPSNILLTRLRPSLYLPLWVLVWSVVSACTGLVQNYGQLVAVRILLGVSEAPFFPGVFFLMSSWYTRRELGLRMAILYSGLIIATAFSGLIAAGVFSGVGGAHGLKGWRWLYIIEGVISFALGIMALFTLPDFTHSKTGSQKWLMTEYELQVAVDRINEDRIEQSEKRSVWSGIKAACLDYRTWVFVLLMIANHFAYGFNYFYPSIVQGFDLGSRTITLVCTAPPFLLAAIISFGLAMHSDRKDERSLHIVIPMLTAIVGFAISVGTLNQPARYFSSFLYVGGCFTSNGLIYGWAAGVLNDSPEKRAVAGAIINVMGQIGNIGSPFFFRSQDEPRYILGMILLMVFAGLCAGCCLFLKFDLKRANKKITRRNEETGESQRLYTT